MVMTIKKVPQPSDIILGYFVSQFIIIHCTYMESRNYSCTNELKSVLSSFHKSATTLKKTDGLLWHQ